MGLPWQTVLAFVRISTSPRAVRSPLTGSQACSIVGSWLGCSPLVVVEPGERFWSIFEQVPRAQISGPLATDAALAALALE